MEAVFSSLNVKTALNLAHVRGVVLLAISEAGLELGEYSPLEVKMSVVGSGRAEKQQVGQMVKLLLGLDAPPSPHDAADAVAIAICHIHTSHGAVANAIQRTATSAPRHATAASLRSWRHYRP